MKFLLVFLLDPPVTKLTSLAQILLLELLRTIYDEYETVQLITVYSFG